ncbi:MAG: hypothetical protein ACRC1H_19350, partial [Caldilineaceae bacterium]
MPLRIADLAKTEKTVTLEYDGESVTVVYRPRLLTTTARLRLLAGPNMSNMEHFDAAMAGEAVEEFFTDVARLLASWDVLDEKGKPMRPTAALLGELPQDFISAVLRAIAEDSGMFPTKGATSPAVSPQTDSPGESL